MGAKRQIKVFIASPGDLAIERRAFKDTIDELNAGFGRGADVEFVPLGWEDALSQVGRRSQAVINQDVDACDVFVLVMWRRWGQEAPDASPYTSYTEEEFYRALARFEKSKAPTIFVFFKQIEAALIADAGPQLTKVLEFRRKLEQTRKVLYRSFTDDGVFKLEIDRHLVAVAKREIAPPDGEAWVPVLPESVSEELNKHKDEARRAVEELEKIRAEATRAQNEAEQAKAEARTAIERAAAAEQLAEAKVARKSVDLAEKAAKAALEGRIEEARQDLAKALDGTTNLRVLYLGFEFFLRIGELDEADRLLRRWLSISGSESESANTAAAYGNLGSIEITRGNLDPAEAYHKKSLAINEKVGRAEGMAVNYGNLGRIERTRGNLDTAEAYHKKSLAIHEKLGRTEGMANEYGNLGAIEQTRGNLDAAEAYHKKSLELNVKQGWAEGMANQYGRLGLIELARGNLDAAEAYVKKSLAINEKLGHKEGIAIQCGNLGEVEIKRSRPEKAREYWTRAVELYGRVGIVEWRDIYTNKLAELDAGGSKKA